MRNFKNWLNESQNENLDKYEGREPHHQYHTEDGHTIHVHVDKNPKGSHAAFLNKSLGYVTKLVHWNVGAKQPSKTELEHAGKDDPNLKEEFFIGEGWLIEKAPPKVKVAKETKHVIDGRMTPNTGGKVTELATMVHLIGHKHAHAGTAGSPEHEAEAKPFKDEIQKMTKGAKKEDVQLRIEHGRAAANNILDDVKLEHGDNAKILNVAHTANAGDIPKFTRGRHNDTQDDNPSDVAVEVGGSNAKKDKKNSDDTHFEGYSLKSSLKSKEITAKNPAVHMDTVLDTPDRPFSQTAEKISREGLKKVHEKMGAAGQKAADRARTIEAERDKARAAGTYNSKEGTELEQQSRVHGRASIQALGEHLYDHSKHLLDNHPDGHKMIGKMLKNHLTSESSMRWKKLKVRGDTPEKVSSTITHGNESELGKLLTHPKTKFEVSKKDGGSTVTYHMIHPQTGERVAIAHYTAKTKSNAYKSDVHGWNVRPASGH